MGRDGQSLLQLVQLVEISLVASSLNHKDGDKGVQVRRIQGCASGASEADTKVCKWGKFGGYKGVQVGQVWRGGCKGVQR